MYLLLFINCSSAVVIVSSLSVLLCHSLRAKCSKMLHLKLAAAFTTSQTLSLIFPSSLAASSAPPPDPFELVEWKERQQCSCSPRVPLLCQTEAQLHRHFCLKPKTVAP